jgi:SynChlorMet cassette radical SAM/SPASM protein ScmE
MDMRVMKTPKTVEIDITNKCNLRCKHCSHFTSAGDVKEDLPTEEWLKFFAELNTLAVTNIILCGGEPFYRPDLKELIEGIIKNRMRFNILSNGTLITDDMAQFLSSTKRCDYVQVSIDGSYATTHDALRGDGAFMAAIQGLKRLMANRVPVGVRVTIHRHNVTDLENIAKLLLEDLKLGGFSTNCASHMGLCRKYSDEIQLTVKEHSLVMEKLLKLNKKYHNRISAQAGPLANAKAWLAMQDARLHKKENLSGRGYLRSCGGVFSKIGVRADGVIVPCNQISHIELGRINRDSLKEIWLNHPELKKLRERRDIPLREFKYCQDCEYINYCLGGCPALSYTIAGDIYNTSPDSCLKRFLEEGGRLPEEILA